MSKIKNAATRILVGLGILVTFSACEMTKQAKVISAEDVRAQPQVSSDVDVDAGADRSMGEPMVSVEKFPSPAVIPLEHVPELPPQPVLERPQVESPVEPVVEPEPEPVVEAEPIVEPETAFEALTSADIAHEEPPASEEVEEKPKDSELEHVFFDFDQYAIRADAASVLERNAERLGGMYEGSNVLIEGHCDERGTTDYNVELGKRRAQAVKEYLVDLGVEESRIRIVSYGKEKPFCRESKPECWQQNRRGHFVLQ